VCPTCRRDLRTCQPSSLEAAEERLLSRRTSDLLFLLSSPVQSQEGDPRVAVGKRYANHRQQRGISPQALSALTPQNPNKFLEIEYAGLYKLPTFLDYFHYPRDAQRDDKTRKHEGG
jgi:hypothetical protein